MATPIWITGFEYGLATPVITGTGLADVVSGGVTIQATTKRTDGYALKCASTGTASYLQKTLTSSNYHVGSVYVYFKDALPNADNIIIRGVNADGDMAVYYESADSKLYAGKVGVSFCATGYTVTYNTWYRIDYRFYTAATTHTADWQVDGVAQTSYSVGSRSSNQMTAIRLGNGAVTSDTYFDDVVISSATADYPIGAHGVVGLRPNVDGTHNNAANIMEDSAGNDIHATNFPAYGYLDENPWVSTYNADYVRQTANGTGNYCEINFADTAQSSIIGAIALLEYSSATDAACTGGCTITDEDATVTTLWGAVGALAAYRAAAIAYYKNVILPNPAGAWDTAAVNALKCRFGYSGDANPDPYWLAIMLEVAYSENTTLTVSPAAFTHAATSPTLVQQHILSGVAACALTHAAITPTLVELRTLTGVAACAFTHAATAPVLTVQSLLVMQSAALASTCDNVALTQAHTLAGVAACALSHAASAPALVQQHRLAIGDAALTHAATAPALIENRTLAVAPCAIALASVNITTLVQNTTLAVSAAALSHAATTLTLVELRTLGVQSAALGHASSVPTLVELRTLAIGAAAITHAAGTITLTQAHRLAVQGAVIELGSTVITFSGGATLLVVDSCALACSASIPALVENRTLSVDIAGFTGTASTVKLVENRTLVIDYAFLGLVADAFALAQAHPPLTMSNAAVALEVQDIMMLDETERVLIPLDLAPRQYVQNVYPRTYNFDSHERAYVIDVDPRDRT